ncbi:MAG: DUF4412 domain-containing protein [Deltaproteobacteria bacterium]|nr:DUF4412 domain-containing protein [Deltaproteobacteria bacterium]
MRANFAAVAMAALLLAPAARAEFEGVVEGRVTGVMAGTFRAQVGKTGIRSEMVMKAGEAVKAGGGQLPPGMLGEMRRVSLQRRAEPGKVYVLDEEKKSYTVIDTAEAAESAKDGPQEQYAVKKLGKDKVAGFPCEKVTATGERSGEMELCVTTELAPEWAKSALSQGRGSGGLIAALRKAGVEGYPVRWSRKDGRGGNVTMELTAAKRQSVPSSAFEIPAGYTEQKGLGGMGMGGNPAARKQMEEAMKNMSPEQRKQMEQLMKGQKGGQ